MGYVVLSLFWARMMGGAHPVNMGQMGTVVLFFWARMDRGTMDDGKGTPPQRQGGLMERLCMKGGEHPIKAE